MNRQNPDFRRGSRGRGRSNYDRRDAGHRQGDRSLEQRFMVESTGVYLESYYHILKTLQSSNPSSLPFEKYFAPNIDDMRESTKALISALTREIVLIEGPPGTGKTVVGIEIMKVLLAKENRKTKIGPILTICFTNHALDQFLEHLLDINIKNIVRLGSRTKSERIKEYNIENVCRTNSYGKEGYELRNSLKEIEKPETNRPLELLLNINSIWKMSRMERITLHDYWRIKVSQESKEILSRLQTMYDRIRNEWSDVYDEGRRQTLLSCDVIGMTTNGAAKFQNLIKSIKPKIIICEEAGEVLEAHILSALTPLTQHLILIGDPNQLRPHIATYDLSMDSNLGKNYQLDKSLFERLVKGDNSAKIDKVQLLTQRRMREIEISDLVRYTLYEELKYGENTAKYEKVRGAQHNVYFINHDHPEDSSDGEFATLSHVNNYEVKMVVEMVKYFIKNGYTKSDDIAVLTPYLGQMMRIKEALSRLFVVVLDERDSQDLAEMEEEQEIANDSNENISASTSEKSLYQQVTLRTVDNFQGEEATIVIVSLVRNFSNSDRYDTIGFIKSTNRSNVLLSRAREGMYLIGNSELMATRSEKMWTPVIDMLRTRNPPQTKIMKDRIHNIFPNFSTYNIANESFEGLIDSRLNNLINLVESYDNNLNETSLTLQ
ncbi:1421_t:CDS:2, partial [Funneliformis geosporum]